jgi:hypothetical protein
LIKQDVARPSFFLFSFLLDLSSLFESLIFFSLFWFSLFVYFSSKRIPESSVHHFEFGERKVFQTNTQYSTPKEEKRCFESKYFVWVFDEKRFFRNQLVSKIFFNGEASWNGKSKGTKPNLLD